MFKKYLSFPREVEAVQFTNENKDQVFNELTGQHAADFEDGKSILQVKTVHGEIAIVRIGDWVVKDAELGTYYPVKEKIFMAGHCIVGAATMTGLAKAAEKPWKASELAQMEVDKQEIWQIVQKYDLPGWDEGFLIWLKRKG